MSKFFNLKARYYLIMFLAMTIIDVVLCVFILRTSNNTLNIILLVVAFLITGSLFDLFISKVFQAKREEKMYIEKRYSITDLPISEKLKGFNKRSLPYGDVYSLVENRCLYKVTIVNNISEYHTFTPDENDKDKTPGVDKAIKMVGFEIFVDTDDELKKNIKGYAISSSKILYDAFYLENGILVEPNHYDPDKNLEEEYNKLVERLGIKGEEGNNNI